MTKKHMHSITVYRLSDNGGKMWPEQRFETENPDDLPALRQQAEKQYAKGLKKKMHSIEAEEYDVEYGTMKINFFGDNE
jgi:hypothetical protein